MARKIIKGQFASATDIGRVRVTNEDQAFSLINADGTVLLGVCDGMGGHNNGEYASKIAKDVVMEEFRNKAKFRTAFGVKLWLSKTIRLVNTRVYDASQERIEYKGMGTTIVLAVLFKDQVFVASVGDSRAYFVRFNDLKQLTVDDTYVEYLKNTGKINEEQMASSPNRHILMNAIGTYPSVSYEIKTFENLKNPILLCSDGVYNNSSDKEIHSILRSNERIDQKIASVIAVANSNGGTDNMAIAYWEAIDND